MSASADVPKTEGNFFFFFLHKAGALGCSSQEAWRARSRREKAVYHCILGALAWSRIVLNSPVLVPIRATWGVLDVNVTGSREMARWVRMFVSQD